MQDIFLPGPFADPDIRAAVFGPDAPGTLTPATLPDHAIRCEPDGARLALIPAPGASAPGAWASAPPDGRARAIFALAVFGGGAAPVSLPGGQIFLAAPGAAPAALWSEPADPEWRLHFLEAVEEALSHYPRRSVAETAALLRGISARALARARGRTAPQALVRRSGLSSAADVEPLALARPYAHYFSLEEHILRHRRFDGQMSAPIERAVFVSGDAVSVLPFDPVRRRVLLIEQFRAGPFARKDPYPWLLEAIAGRCDVGEAPEAAARREALEEANLTLGRMDRITGFYMSPGAISEYLTAYVAEADLTVADGFHGLAAEDEDIRVLTLPLADALDLVQTGEAANAPLLISLLWLRSEAERLSREWTTA